LDTKLYHLYDCVKQFEAFAINNVEDFGQVDTTMETCTALEMGLEVQLLHKVQPWKKDRNWCFAHCEEFSKN
jgi:hypothetical protein